MNASVRMEHDLLGTLEVPADAYYGIHTLRALRNFPITDIPLNHYPVLIVALAMVKKAAAQANADLGLLDKDLAQAVVQAADDVIAGRCHDQFVVDMIQGGAGTSTNMNANEVIANLALEKMGLPKGEYAVLHPLNHVNLSQSTNDVYPTAIRLAILLDHGSLSSAMRELYDAFRAKAREFSAILKVGRTQLQDAVPMALGQEFDAFAATIQEDIDRIEDLVSLFREVNLGGTAIGTGINTHSGYARLAVEHLCAISGIDLVSAPDLVEATSDTGAYVTFAGVLKRVAVKISKVCNDLRLLSSGPRAGLGEISLPAVQAGSSIMPGKVNPVIPEVVNQVAFQVIAADIAVTLAAEGGQLQLNAFEPLIAFNILQAMRMMTRAMTVLRHRCVQGITANESRCRQLLEGSFAVVTALNPYIGYENASRIAGRALHENRSVYDLVIEEGLLAADKLAEILEPHSLLHPRGPSGPGGRRD